MSLNLHCPLAHAELFVSQDLILATLVPHSLSSLACTVDRLKNFVPWRDRNNDPLVTKN
jgi:hypothetical protein